MRTSHSVKWILAGALILPGLTGCSLFGEGDDGEVATTEEAAPADVEALPESNAQAEATDGAEGIGSDGNALNEVAVPDPAAAEGNPLGGSEIPPELLANGGTPSATDPMAGTTAMGSAPGSDPAAAGAGGFAAPPSDVRVYYVNADTATLRSSPDASGQSVGALKKGDPVLVKVEGNWANVVNRGWVELASLSMGPVARAKAAKAWN